MSKFKFKIGNFEVELEGEDEFVKQSISDTFEFVKSSSKNLNFISSDIQSLPSTSESLNKQTTRVIEDENNTETLSIFIDSKNFKTDWQKIVGTCYYMQKIEFVETFTQKAVREFFEISTLPNLSNFSMAFNKAVEENMLKVVDKAEKTYSLTSIGERFVKEFVNDNPKIKKTIVSKTTKKQISDEDKSVIDNIKKLSSNFEKEDLDFLESLKTQKEQIYYSSYMYSKKFGDIPLKPIYISSLINATGIDNLSDIAVTKVFSANKKYYEIEKRGLYRFTQMGIRDMENLKQKKEEC